jgi:L-rhamnose isomerase
LLEPLEKMQALEAAGDFGGRLAMLEALKGLPSGAVWDFYCLQQDVPVGISYMDGIRAYEKQVLSQRS